MVYFPKYSKLVGVTSLPKFALYTTHDEIMGAYFEALDWHRY